MHGNGSKVAQQLESGPVGRRLFAPQQTGGAQDQGGYDNNMPLGQ